MDATDNDSTAQNSKRLSGWDLVHVSNIKPSIEHAIAVKVARLAQCKSMLTVCTLQRISRPSF